MALKHKAALVDLSNISKPVSKSAEDNEKPVRTSIGMHADAIFRDEKIAAELKRFRRAGVPLVLVYPKDPKADPLVLPELLTPGIVLEALEKAAK